MLIESTVHLPFGLAILQDLFHPPTGDELFRIIVRWFHFAAGITWIGLLYFFNLINVPFQKTIDAPTKKAVNPELLGRSLWWFRWGAVVTVLAGLTYYAMFILKADVTNANNAGIKANVWVILLVWLLIPVVVFIIEYFILMKGLIGDGRVLAVVIAILVILMSAAILWWLSGQLTGTVAGRPDSYASNKTYSIGIGGALGIIMMLNVWGIIWPAQKRILAATVEGTPAPPELARRAFLASRANAWLSLPMLFFMGTSHGDYIIFGK